MTPRRIVIIKPSALGDIMHSLPVLRALRRRYPDAHLAWVVNRLYEPLLTQHPDLDQVIPFDRTAGKRSLIDGVFGFGKFLRHLRAQRFDLAIDLQGLLRTGVMTYATGAKLRLGLASAREGARYFYTDRVEDRDKGLHAVERYWRVAEHLDAGNTDKIFHLPIDASAQAWSRNLLSGWPRPWLAVGVGARWTTKRWLPAHFAEVVRRAQAEFGGTAVFVGAPDEALLAREAARSLTGPVLELVGQTSLPQLAALLGACDLMLGNDTGPLHLAVALGRPVVAPYTCTSDRKTGPFGPQHRVVETQVHCAGSYVKTCDRMECMSDLSPDRLWPSLREILQSCSSNRHSA